MTGDGHLDLDTLAELDEGLVADDAVTGVTAHLDDCAECRDRHAALRTTRALLTTMPAEPMPADVAARVDAAIAEAALTSPTVVPLERRRRWTRHPTLPGLAAAFAAAALVSALLIGVWPSHPDKGASSAARGAAPSSAAPVTYPVTTSGNHYSKANVATLVPTLLRGHGPAASGGAAPNTGAVSTPRPIDPRLARLYGSPGALRACVTTLNAGNPAAADPLAVDFASYLGQPAVVVVLPGIDPANVDAWIVGPQCGAPTENLLLYESLPRPPG